jgi:hypothetical protein
MTPSGIEPATYRLLAQCLNQLRHQQHALNFTRVVLFYDPGDSLLINLRSCVDVQSLARVLLLHQILTNWDTTAGNRCVDYLHVYSSVRSLHTSQCT